MHLYRMMLSPRSKRLSGNRRCIRALTRYRQLSRYRCVSRKSTSSCAACKCRLDCGRESSTVLPEYRIGIDSTQTVTTNRLHDADISDLFVTHCEVILENVFPRFQSLIRPFHHSFRWEIRYPD